MATSQNYSKLIEQDQKSIWHPFTQLKTAQPFAPIVKGEGVYLFDDRGNKYIDAVSSWWVNLHGHCHPYISEKIKSQLDLLEHVTFADFTHAPAIELASRLLPLLPGTMSKIFYVDNGSSAVETALKMALQYRFNRGEKKIESDRYALQLSRGYLWCHGSIRQARNE